MTLWPVFGNCSQAVQRSLPDLDRRVSGHDSPLRNILNHDGPRTDHGAFRLDPEGRNARHTYVLPAEDKLTWRVQQMLVDPEENNDWVAEFEVDLAASRSAGAPVLRLQRLGSYR